MKPPTNSLAPEVICIYNGVSTIKFDNLVLVQKTLPSVLK